MFFFSSYNVNVCLMFNGSEKIDIYYIFYIKSIYSFIELIGKFLIIGFVVFIWRDLRIFWLMLDLFYDVILLILFKV